MNYLRKALALLVAVLLLMPAGLSMVSAATFSDVTAGTAMYEAVTNLANLGIIEGYPDNTFKPDNIITRAEFAAVITRFLNIDGAADESLPTGFPDVDDVNHWAKKYIRLAVDYQVVNGYEDGLFRPDDPVKYTEAVKMIVCALGYGQIAQQRTFEGAPWYQGYLIIAAEKGILSKATVDNNENPAPRGIVAILTNNALDVKVVVPIIGSEGQYTEGKTAKESFDKTKISGIITAVYETALDSSDSGLLENQVKVYISRSQGEKTYKLDPGVDVSKYLGYRIVGYEVENQNDYDHPYLTKIEPSANSNRLVTVNAELIDGPATETKLYYYASEDAARTSSITFNSDMTMIYNGKYVDFDIDYLNNVKCGKIDFLYVDNSNLPSVAFISDYKIYVVHSVYVDGDAITIYPKYGESSFELDPDDPNYTLSVVSKKGQKVAPNNIKANDVLSVLRSNASSRNVIKVIVSSDKLSNARVTELTSTNEYQLTVGSSKKYYRLSYPYLDGLAAGRADTPELALGDSVTAYLDHEDKIAFVETGAATESLTVGYLYNADIDDDMNAGNTKMPLQVGIYTKDGRQSHYLAKNVRINGKTYNNPETVLALLEEKAGLGNEGRPFESGDQKYAQLVRFAVNSSQDITTLNLPELETTNTQDLKLSVFADPANKMRYNDEKKQLVPVSGNPISVSSSTMVFFVPYDRLLTENYSYRTANNLIDGKEYYCEVYNLNMGSMVASYVVVFNNKVADQITAESRVFVVGAAVKQTTDEKKGISIWRVDGWDAKTGDSKTLETTESDVFSGLSIGDVFQYETDSAGYVMTTQALIRAKEIPNYTPLSDFDSARYARVRERKVDDELPLAEPNEQFDGDTMKETSNIFTIFGTVVGLGDGRIRISPQLLIDDMDFDIAGGDTADFNFTQSIRIIAIKKTGSTYTTEVRSFSSHGISDLYSKQSYPVVNLTDPSAPNFVSESDRERYYKRDVSKVFAYATKGAIRTMVVYIEN